MINAQTHTGWLYELMLFNEMQMANHVQDTTYYLLALRCVYTGKQFM